MSHLRYTRDVSMSEVNMVIDYLNRVEAERDALKAMIYTVMNISEMSDAQLAELRANALQAMNGEKP